MATNFLKRVVDSIVVRLKAKEIYSHITQGQKNDKPFSDSAGWLTCFKSQYNIKNGKLAGEAGSVEQIVQPRTSFYIFLIHMCGD